MESFLRCLKRKHLKISDSQMKALVLDLRQSGEPLTAVTMWGGSIDSSGTLESTSVAGCSSATAQREKVQRRLFFWRRLRSFSSCSKPLDMFYQSVIASDVHLLFAGSNINIKEPGRLNRPE